MLSQLLLTGLILLCSGQPTQVLSLCNHMEEVHVFRCLSPLLEYADLSQRLLHPPLSGIEKNCEKYREYLQCTAGVSQHCRQSRVLHVEDMYMKMCEENYLNIAKEEQKCLKKLESDKPLKECFVNGTNVLRDDRVTNDAVELANNNMECPIIQTYVECLFEREFEDCSEAVKIEVSLLASMASREDGSECQLKIKDLTRSRPAGELIKKCDANGNCECNSGYIYHNTLRKCVDIDECEASTHDCSQRCINIPGSFECGCEPRFFYLSTDNRTCVRKDNEALTIFISLGKEIWKVTPGESHTEKVSDTLKLAPMIDFDIRENQLYYADMVSNTIKRVNISGGIPQIIQQTNVYGEGIAVDWLGRNLYSLQGNSIVVQSLDGKYRRTLYQGMMGKPRAIALHPMNGKLFVSDWSSAFIAVASMDGTSFEKIITNQIIWPNALTVDIYSDKLYWADAYYDKIEVVNLDGSGRRILIENRELIPHIFSMVVADDYLYWTDWSYNGTLRANKITGDDVSVLYQTPSKPYSLKIFHPSLQPQEASDCDERKCSHLCLLGINGAATCACSDGYILESDGKSCTLNCTTSQLACGGSEPKCISQLYRCDGFAHCADRADEKDCPSTICMPGHFQCHDNKKCAPQGGLCDGVPDCADGSDEIYCDEYRKIVQEKIFHKIH